MRLDKLTIKAQEALQKGRDIATENSHQEIAPEHLLLALLDQNDGVVVSLLKKLGMEPGLLDEQTRELLKKIPQVEGVNSGDHLSRNLGDILNKAFREAEDMKDEYVSTEHLLLALTSDNNGVGRLLKDRGVSRNAILKALAEIRGSQRVTDQNPEDKYQALNKFTRDLTEAARKGKLDP
ncbi:MAG: type VI secretion system ATPase TssH, partial [Planctomycetes bacterium]|nr:type VI secretion system ATPase TssH [Planctomycetota bacterium]